MIELSGALAVSEFRIAKLRPALEALQPGLGAVTARFVHFVDISRELDAGASILVVGRPITQAEDPDQAARAIEATL